ncbi:hypothetical protein [Clostridium sp. BL-8]|uniref:RICIN domain-containing protein n=1 Tax=Clostridium sp. BL-8 TaxID=349938 RepID=UPI0009D2689E|nr:hypothetical protein [Clostridium sp. BL-8]OOM76758.1 ricin-type beta-trefoil lectin domain protein [Clostridium sp. BL-8]
MKKSKLTKVIATPLIIVSLIVLNPIGASAEWRQNSTGWWYAEGDSYATGWRLIDGKYYYFSDNGYMLHDTYIDGYKLGSDGAWVVSTPRISTTSDYVANPVNLQILHGLDTDRNLLSCTDDGTVVNLWSVDDESGRQKWRFTRVKGYNDVYNITVVRGVYSGRTYLSATPDGDLVNLWPEDDGSGRQRWQLVPVQSFSGHSTYLIKVYDGVCSDRKYLSCSADGTIVNLWPEDDGSGRQIWSIPNNWKQ